MPVNMHQSTEDNVQQMLMILERTLLRHFQKNGHTYAALRGTSILTNCGKPNEEAIHLVKEHNISLISVGIQLDK